MTALILPFRLGATLCDSKSRSGRAVIGYVTRPTRARGEHRGLMPNYQYEFSDFPRVDPLPPPGLPSAVEAIMARIMAAGAQTPYGDDRAADESSGWLGTEANVRVAPPQR